MARGEGESSGPTKSVYLDLWKLAVADSWSGADVEVTMHKTAAASPDCKGPGAVESRRKHESSNSYQGATDRTEGQGPAQAAGETTPKENETKTGLSKVPGQQARHRKSDRRDTAVVFGNSRSTVMATGGNKLGDKRRLGWESRRRRRRLAENYFYFLGPASHWRTVGLGSGE